LSFEIAAAGSTYQRRFLSARTACRASSSTWSPCGTHCTVCRGCKIRPPSSLKSPLAIAEHERPSRALLFGITKPTSLCSRLAPSAVRAAPCRRVAAAAAAHRFLLVCRSPEPVQPFHSSSLPVSVQRRSRPLCVVDKTHPYSPSLPYSVGPVFVNPCVLLRCEVRKSFEPITGRDSVVSGHG
jgi:hypothetical protein